MTDRTLLAALVAVTLLTSAMPAPALAQGAPQPVLLDQDTTEVGSVTVDGQRYHVYRHQNVFGYASGIDIYTDGRRVTSPSVAEEVLTALAQRRALAELGSDELAALRATGRNASAIAQNVSAAATTLNRTVAHLRELHSVRRNGTTAYNASVAAAPRIPEFNETAGETLPELRSLADDLREYASNATTLVALLEKRANGSDVDPQRVYARYVATVEAKRDVTEHLGYYGVDDDLSTLADVSATIASNVSTAPVRGNATARQFAAVHEETAVAANRTAGFELSEADIDSARQRAGSIEETWMEQWRSRRGAASDVYKSLGAIGVAVVGAVGYVGWRRR